MDIQQKIEDIIISDNNEGWMIQELLMLSDSYSRFINFYRYVERRGFGSDLNPCDYWNYLGQAYNGSDNTYEYTEKVKDLFGKPFPHKDSLMDNTERGVLQELSDPVKIHRGMTVQESIEGERDPKRYGISWTLKEETAVFFAQKYIRNHATAGMKKTVVTKMVPKKDIIAYFRDRDEQEVIYMPYI